MRRIRLGPAQAWRRVLGELVVIVAGVLIALALDSWWESHQDRERESAYLSQLLKDLRETEARLQTVIDGDSSMLQQVSSVLDRALNGPLPSPDSLGLPTGYTQFRPLTGTQAALVQSGDLGLLQNDSIRFEVIAYQALIDATETILRHTEALTWNSTERVLLGRARHSRSAASSGGRTRGPIDVAAVLGDPEVISAMQVQAVASQTRVRSLQRLQDPTASLIRLIAAEMRRR